MKKSEFLKRKKSKSKSDLLKEAEKRMLKALIAYFGKDITINISIGNVDRNSENIPDSNCQMIGKHFIHYKKS